ncbi:putative bacteriophage protein [Rodentibacter pneumotropicus]|uniref:Putative bacteriophage protein n=1 Tax=Rodentibacter pneumotropicus TaxID=758 RepID=A0A3S5ES53_9PAST|nr:putative bacteriophage protein [Rodentibacter pneumotropicus]
MAKFQMMKLPGGVFSPANEAAAEALQKFRNGEQYEIEIKQVRNPAFHRKVFAFFNFCFEHWSADKTEWQYFDERKQFDTFRKNLTVLAGYKEVTYTLDGSLRVEAQSLSYGNMEQGEFEQCYSALINAAIKHVFGNTTDENVINQLYAFF